MYFGLRDLLGDDGTAVPEWGIEVDRAVSGAHDVEGSALMAELESELLRRGAADDARRVCEGASDRKQPRVVYMRCAGMKHSVLVSMSGLVCDAFNVWAQSR